MSLEYFSKPLQARSTNLIKTLSFGASHPLNNRSRLVSGRSNVSGRDALDAFLGSLLGDQGLFELKLVLGIGFLPVLDHRGDDQFFARERGLVLLLGELDATQERAGHEDAGRDEGNRVRQHGRQAFE